MSLVNFSGDHMSEQKIAQYTDLFIHFDYYETGTIHIQSLKLILKSMNVNIQQQLLSSLVLQSGNSNPTSITLTQFLAIISLLIQDTQIDKQIEQTFKLFDTDKSGVIDIKDIEHGFAELKIDLKDGDIADMLKACKRSSISYGLFHKNILDK